MHLLLAVLLTPLLLAGCARIPYEKPEDRAAIQKDLALRPEDVVTMTQVLWCAHPYGDMTPCQLQDALAVQTRTRLILASYGNKHYETILQPQADEVMCAHAQASVNTAPNYYIFTEAYALQIRPVDSDEKPDLAKKKIMLDAMTKGKKIFVGTQGEFVKDTGRYDYGGGFIANTKISYSTTTKILQLVNPCGEQE